jgi:hypothetical protein
MKHKTNREEGNLDELDLSCRVTAYPSLGQASGDREFSVSDNATSRT